ncbi:MAG: hypothetical protein Q9170_005814 [Blastenia crenularia]
MQKEIPVEDVEGGVALSRLLQHKYATEVQMYPSLPSQAKTPYSQLQILYSFPNYTRNRYYSGVIRIGQPHHPIPSNALLRPDTPTETSTSLLQGSGHPSFDRKPRVTVLPQIDQALASFLFPKASSRVQILFPTVIRRLPTNPASSHPEIPGLRLYRHLKANPAIANHSCLLLLVAAAQALFTTVTGSKQSIKLRQTPTTIDIPAKTKSTELSDQASSIHRHLNLCSHFFLYNNHRPRLTFVPPGRTLDEGDCVLHPCPRRCWAGLEIDRIGILRKFQKHLSCPTTYTTSDNPDRPYIILASVCSFADFKALRRPQGVSIPPFNHTITIVISGPQQPSEEQAVRKPFLVRPPTCPFLPGSFIRSWSDTASSLTNSKFSQASNAPFREIAT